MVKGDDMTILKVERVDAEHQRVSYPADHPKKKDIERWLGYLSPGYVEFLLKRGCDPHCSACRAEDCENVGMGDDACPAFKFGEEW